MTSHLKPPRWADRFLMWYCNPELLEEIQGDAHEIYFDRVEKKGKRVADFLYLWDVIRFCRPSNIRRETDSGKPGFFGLFWNLNSKLVIRNAMRNKLVFSTKIVALSTCIAFALMLTAVVINDLTYDHQYDYRNLYRIGCHVVLQGKESNYAVSPLPLGPTLAEEVPGVESYTRFMMVPHPVLEVDENQFHGTICYSADVNFLKLFPQRFLEGTETALDEPNKIVLTHSMATRLFGDQPALDKVLELNGIKVDIAAVIQDPPSNSHFTFESLVSWETFQRVDSWTNINAYTYIRMTEKNRTASADSLISLVANDYLRPMMDDYKFTFDPIIQRIDEIHLSGFMDEDFAAKRSRSYVYIMISVLVLFLLTGLFNYLNLALAELTMQVKKIAVLRAFGGSHADHRTIAYTDALFSLLVVAPLVLIIMFVTLFQFRLFTPVDSSIWTTPAFLTIVGAIILLILFASGANGYIMSAKNKIAVTLKGSIAPSGQALGLRKMLVAGQLAFSLTMIGLIVVILDQFQFMNEADKGFESSNVIVIKRYGKSRDNATLEDAIRDLAGVTRVAGSSFYPEGPVETKDILELETATGRKNLLINFMFAEQEYPELLGMRLASGRFFHTEGASNENTFLINEAAAKLLGWDDPLGKTIAFPDGSQSGPIVGVVRDFHFESLHTTIAPLVIIYTDGDWGINYLYVKSDPASLNIVSEIESEYKAIFPDVPMDWNYLDARYQSLYSNDHEIKEIFRSGLFISVLISMLGIFSISALILSLKAKEMGVRKVVGASHLHLFILHLKPFVTFFTIALLIGLPLVYFLSAQWLGNFAYRVSLGAGNFLIPVILTIVMILLSAGYHAMRSTQVDPVEVLKGE